MLLDFVFKLEQLELMRCISLFDSWYDESQAFKSLCGRPPWLFEAIAESSFCTAFTAHSVILPLRSLRSTSVFQV